MISNRKFLTLTVVTLGLLLSNTSLAQYWIGPKVGYHYSIHDYQDFEYEDAYQISNDHGFEAGMVVTYTATDRYAVHGELYFEQIGNRIRSRGDNFFVNSKSTYNFLSLPLMLRVSMGHSPVHWYVNGGPKLSLWLGGNGRLKYSDDEAANPNSSGVFDGIEHVNYTIAFNSGEATGVLNDTYFVDEPNRIQYALVIGGGFYLDLANGARLMIDGRYNWGHSNMAFNQDPNVASSNSIIAGSPENIPERGYQENYEYTTNTISISIAYMYEYNAQLKRKGGSTNSESRDNRRSVRRKRN